MDWMANCIELTSHITPLQSTLYDKTKYPPDKDKISM